MILQSERLYVRRFTLHDNEMFYRLNSDEDVMRYIRPVKDRNACDLFLAENITFYDLHPGLGRFALLEKATNVIIGIFSMLPLEYTTDVHIGYALMKDQWGKGYASEIVKAGITYAFDHLRLTTLVAVTYPEHTASQKVLLRNNFQPDGVYQEDGHNNLLFRLNSVTG
ncbi:MAG TPA: GNAT family N-acetyltransferase [Chitinophagaceae bacterium]